MLQDDFFNEHIVELNVEAKDSSDAIKKTGEMLIQNNYVNKSYIDSVIEREKIFPTGLALTSSGVAIPHATPKSNVFKDGIGVIRLIRPIDFNCMEDPDKKVSVSMIFMLALSKSDTHLSVLKKLFAMFQNNELVEKLQKSYDKNVFLQILANSLS